MGADGSLRKSELPPPAPAPFRCRGVPGGVPVKGSGDVFVGLPVLPVVARVTEGLARGNTDELDEPVLRAADGHAVGSFSDKLPCSAAEATRLIQENHSSPASGRASRSKASSDSAFRSSSVAVPVPRLLELRLPLRKACCPSPAASPRSIATTAAAILRSRLVRALLLASLRGLLPRGVRGERPVELALEGQGQPLAELMEVVQEGPPEPLLPCLAPASTSCLRSSSCDRSVWRVATRFARLASTRSGLPESDFSSQVSTTRSRSSSSGWWFVNPPVLSLRRY
mmetsp:Transcript_64936/g.118492  ORF Transcript_64936/g.118492 Transcript_64936/m.118492 type:complete len:284 (+) Transcript_64936:750-1601(+)